MRWPPEPESGARPSRGEGGFALLIVLWTLVLITLLVASMTAAGRSEVQLTASLRDAAIVREAVDGAAEEAIFHLAAGQWTPGPAPYQLRIGDTRVAVQVEDEAGKVNPNDTSPPMLRALLGEIGVPAAQAYALAAAIQDYRTFDDKPSPGGAKAAEYLAAGRPYGPAGHPFFSVRELGVVLGMTPDILARLAPYVSVYKAAGFDVTKADPLVRRAFAAAGPNGGYRPGQLRLVGPATIRVTARAIGAGAAATRAAVIRLPVDAPPAGPRYELMDWD
jgi:general secretion pathway protein K